MYKEYIKKKVNVLAGKYTKGMEDYFKCHAYESWSRDRCTFSCGNAKDYRDTCFEEGLAVPYVDTPSGTRMVKKTDYIVVIDDVKHVFTEKEFNILFESEEENKS